MYKQRELTRQQLQVIVIDQRFATFCFVCSLSRWEQEDDGERHQGVPHAVYILVVLLGLQEGKDDYTNRRTYNTRQQEEEVAALGGVQLSPPYTLHNLRINIHHQCFLIWLIYYKK